MKEELQRWDSLTLETFNSLMFEELIYPHNIVTETAKEFTLEDKDGDESDPVRGYFAMKDVDGKKTKYFIPDEFYKELPIRIDRHEEMLYKDSGKSKSVVLMTKTATPFRIRPAKVWESNHQFIDDLAPFTHSRPEMWTLNKIIAIVGYVGKSFIGVCSASEFGKSSTYSLIDSITKKSPVFQPRSVPGLLAQITGDGNMVLDEPQDCVAEVRKIMENFSLQVGGNAPIYINGAMRSTNTKPRYDVAHQSITFLYNVYSNYREPEKQFFDFVWSNQKAMDSRFLRLKLEGTLQEKFDKNFNIIKVAEDNKLFYISIAKHLLYLKEMKLHNSYERRYTKESPLHLKGRHKIIYDEITWGIDLYADSQKEYEDYVNLLDSCITAYQEMLGKGTSYTPQLNPIKEEQTTIAEEEVGLEFDTKNITWTKCSKCGGVECNMDMAGKPYCKDHWKDAKR